ncbi:MAG: hypothetical protein KDD82_25885 [Planctomycetes bacterium]|nr:hypothetical protein [Planctomycetota bacterium]
MADSTSTPSKRAKKTEDTSPLDVLRDNAGMMIAVLVALVAFAALVVYQSGQNQVANDEAWWALAEQQRAHPQGTEGFDELLKKHGDSPAGTQIRLTYASRLYETGVRADVEKAKQLFIEAKASSKDSELLQRALTEQIESIQKELEAQPSALLDVAPPPEPEEEGPEFPGGMSFPPVPGK